MPGYFDFLIGGIHARVRPDLDRAIVVLPSWKPFLNCCGQEPDAWISLKEGIPPGMSRSELLFDGLNEEGILRLVEADPGLAALGQTTWSVHRAAGSTVVVMGGGLCYLRVEGEREFSVYYPSTGLPRLVEESVIQLFTHPLASLLLYYLAVGQDAVLLHACGVYHAARGMAFSGFSGAGKTTIARLFAGAGGRLINDDRLLLRFVHGQVHMYNTPMMYTDVPKMAPLHQLYFISHAPGHTLRSLGPALAAARMLSCSILHPYDRQGIARVMEVASRVGSELSCHELGFRPEASVVEFIQQHDQGK